MFERIRAWLAGIELFGDGDPPYPPPALSWRSVRQMHGRSSSYICVTNEGRAYEVWKNERGPGWNFIALPSAATIRRIEIETNLSARTEGVPR